MSERLIAGWGVRIVEQSCGCDGRGFQPGNKICMCEAGKRIRDAAGGRDERKVLAEDER